MRIFEIAIIFVPRSFMDAAAKTGEAPQILVKPTPVLARDERTAQTLAARMIPAEYETRLDEVQVAVRPF